MNRVAAISGIEVAVNVHSWLTSYPYPGGGILERENKLKLRKPGEANVFVEGREFAGELRESLRAAMAGGAQRAPPHRLGGPRNLEAWA